jgi:hypothetical protein
VIKKITHYRDFDLFTIERAKELPTPMMGGSPTSFLDPTDGVFLNVNGSTGEMIRDPHTGEVKVVVGSNQPIGGGAGGTTLSTASGQTQTNAPSPSSSLNAFFAGQLFGVPVWMLGFIILIVVLIGADRGLSRR